MQELERRLLPFCEVAREQAARIYPKYTFNVWSSSVGGETSFQGHNLGVEAIFPDALQSQSNTVALIVGLRHLTTDAEIDDACVAWGAGDAPDVSIELFTDPVPFNDANLSYVEERFQILLDKFFEAVAAYSADSAA